VKYDCRQKTVIPAQAGIQTTELTINGISQIDTLDSRLRGKDSEACGEI
jgi:hypothetical protein